MKFFLLFIAMFFAVLVCPVHVPYFCVSAKAGAEEAKEPDSGYVIVKLNNGGNLSGRLAQKDAAGLVLDIGYGEVTVSASDVKSIQTDSSRAPGKDIAEEAGAGSILTKIKKQLSSEETKKAVLKRNNEYVKIREQIADEAMRKREYRVRFQDPSQIAVNVVLNRKVQAMMVVDTGASLVLLPRTIGDRLFPSALRSRERIPTRLADGTVRTGIPVMLRSVEIGNLKAENIQAIIMDAGEDMGLLGMSFLSRFHVNIDSTLNELVLRIK